MNRFLSLAAVVALAGLAAGPAMGAIIYDNTNGFANMLNDGGYTVSNIADGDRSLNGFSDFSIAGSFSLGASDSIQSINLWLWEPTGTETDALSSLGWAILNNDGSTFSPFDGTVVASGPDPAPSMETPFINPGGFSRFEETFGIGGVALTGGTQYCVVIGNATSTSGTCIPGTGANCNYS